MANAGVGEISNTFRNCSFSISMMAQLENCRDALGSRHGRHLRAFRVHCLVTILSMVAIWCSAVWAQIEPGQAVASIPAKDGDLLVQNGLKNEVWLVTDNGRVSVNADEALGAAAWIKEGKMGEYADSGPVRFRRESGTLIVTLVPQNAGEKELRLGDAEALQLAAALASVRQNVSEAGQ